ncbi:DNA primase [Coriobacteriales bacterium OH1046]|nr:DNA primase [Coriobacteriales bacterium OH1046]
MISDDDIQRVRQATNIVDLVSETVVLKQRGQEFWGCCPFHNEKTPSFHVNPATGLWHCFGACQEGGDAISYIRKRDNLEFADAVRALADKAGIEISEDAARGPRGPRRNRLIEALVEAERFYHVQLMRGKSHGAASARSYLSSRGFGSEICRRWCLGYAPGRGALVAHLRGKGFSAAELHAANLSVDRSGRTSDRFYERVMFPIHDEQGRAIAFGGRVLGKGEPKYLNSSETPVFHKSKNLYALDRAKDRITATATAILCEGYTDVIALHEAGFANAVAALGTALTLDHIRMLSRYRVREIICLFDGDAAGQRAAERTVQYIDKTEADLRCVVLPDGQDPAEFLGSHSPSELQAQLDSARSLVDFVIEARLDKYDLSTPGRRVKALDDVAEVLAPLKRSVLIDELATKVAYRLPGIEATAVKTAVRDKAVPRAADALLREKPDRIPAADPAPSFDSLSVSERRQLKLEREVLSLVARYPDELRSSAPRMTSIIWADARHEAMLWAMLSTPEKTAPKDAVAAALSVEPQAARILSAGEAVSSPSEAAQRAASLLDALELSSDKRRLKEVRGKLHGSSALGDAELTALFEEATRLQKRINELSELISRASIR